MAIRMIEDVGAPLTVTAIDMITLEAAPEWNEWAAYLMAAGGFVGGFLGFGGPFVKNIGVASLPLAARAIRERVKAGGVSRAPARAGNLSYRAVSRGTPPIRQSTVPEFEDVRVH